MNRKSSSNVWWLGSVVAVVIGANLAGCSAKEDFQISSGYGTGAEYVLNVTGDSARVNGPGGPELGKFRIERDVLSASFSAIGESGAAVGKQLHFYVQADKGKSYACPDCASVDMPPRWEVAR